MKIVQTLFAVALLASGANAMAQKACSAGDEANASKAIDRIVSWAVLNATWKTYGHCDKGAVDDQFTEAVMRMMVDWKDAKQLAEAMKKDSEYSAFIFKHIKSPAAKDDLDDVHSRARTVCPKGYEDWCKTIADAAVPPREPPPAAPPAELKSLPPVTAPPEKK
ncbi:hypothetical protein [Usitatibacter palustris]|uniref:HdeA/HdeB family protein n=1 Tax=Usitatibacter palustris TaxID=2732487 RepID=A0A6M4HEW0_9PROT|nr:hypothetical protein [Usitatibacter palustris]QJR16567.1 hypothetical protein DSM104440_03402 [Usitatibacter palustris]